MSKHKKRGIRPPDMSRAQAMKLMTPFMGGGVVQIIRKMLANSTSAIIRGQNIISSPGAQQLKSRLLNPAKNQNINPANISKAQKDISDAAGLRAVMVFKGILRKR